MLESYIFMIRIHLGKASALKEFIDVEKCCSFAKYESSWSTEVPD